MSDPVKPPFGAAYTMYDTRRYPIGVRWELIHGDYMRAVQCIEACAGMSDPASEIARLKAEDHPGPHEKERILAERSAEIDALRAERDRYLVELECIATAKPHKWEPDMQDQFQAWAQNRALAALARSQKS